MSKSEDLEYTEELKLKVWALVARNKLAGRANPEVVEERAIMSHGGRIKKALRLLGDYVSYEGTVRTTYSSTKTYRVHNFEESKNLGVNNPDVFLSTMKEYHSLLFNRYYGRPFDSVDYLGYNFDSDLLPPLAIYIYWHQDEYDVYRKDEKGYVYPKSLLDTRRKAILRAAIEEDLNNDFSKKIERYLDLKEGSLEGKLTEKITTARVYSSLSGSFNRDMFEGENGFQEEMQHFSNYYNALLNNLTQFINIINKKGGYEVILEQMRRDSIKNIIKRAPLRCANRKERESYNDGVDTNLINKYILNNASIFNYEYIYNEDPSIEDITETMGSFTPEEQELLLINNNNLTVKKVA